MSHKVVIWLGALWKGQLQRESEFNFVEIVSRPPPTGASAAASAVGKTMVPLAESHLVGVHRKK